jgi:hypothetical protein
VFAPFVSAAHLGGRDFVPDSNCSPRAGRPMLEAADLDASSSRKGSGARVPIPGSGTYCLPGSMGMDASTTCPYCGHRSDAGAPQRAADAETIELLSREVRQLRETVARLRACSARASAIPDPGDRRTGGF